MPTLDQMLHPRCPNHPDYVVERFGVCCVCEMTTHRHLSGFKLIASSERVAYRTEANCYDQQGVVDDD